jgi:diaminopimelate decarboxylase
MFTGIVEEVGEVLAVIDETGGRRVRIGTTFDRLSAGGSVSVDGGMSDNLRPMLYDARYEAEIADRFGGETACTIAGMHCESGDIVRERASLSADLRVGDLLAVAATGAYTESMASNYNRLPRPAAVLVRDGASRTLIRRETYDDLVARDVPLDG